MTNHRTVMKKLKKLNALLTPVEPRRIEVRRQTDRELLYAVGEGETHTLMAVESQVDYLRGISKRLGSSTSRTDILIGDARSGTSWAGLVATISLAVDMASDAGIFCGAHLVEDTHRLLRTILPSSWFDEDSEETGRYRLPREVDLHVVSVSSRKPWPTRCGVVMVNDYGGVTEEKLDAILREGEVQVVTGNPPSANDLRRAWILGEWARAQAAGSFYQFHSNQNQSLRGNPAHREQFERIVKGGSLMSRRELGR